MSIFILKFTYSKIHSFWCTVLWILTHTWSHISTIIKLQNNLSHPQNFLLLTLYIQCLSPPPTLFLYWYSFAILRIHSELWLWFSASYCLFTLIQDSFTKISKYLNCNFSISLIFAIQLHLCFYSWLFSLLSPICQHSDLKKKKLFLVVCFSFKFFIWSFFLIFSFPWRDIISIHFKTGHP